MSSDYYIHLDSAYEAGVETCTRVADGEVEETALFPFSHHARMIDIDPQSEEIHVSCGGQFRNDLQKWLDEEGVSYSRV